jgi:hypothetical protein
VPIVANSGAVTGAPRSSEKLGKRLPLVAIRTFGKVLSLALWKAGVVEAILAAEPCSERSNSASAYLPVFPFATRQAGTIRLPGSNSA